MPDWAALSEWARVSVLERRLPATAHPNGYVQASAVEWLAACSYLALPSSGLIPSLLCRVRRCSMISVGVSRRVLPGNATTDAGGGANAADPWRDCSVARASARLDLAGRAYRNRPPMSWPRLRLTPPNVSAGSSGPGLPHPGPIRIRDIVTPPVLLPSGGRLLADACAPFVPRTFGHLGPQTNRVVFPPAGLARSACGRADPCMPHVDIPLSRSRA